MLVPVFVLMLLAGEMDAFTCGCWRALTNFSPNSNHNSSSNGSQLSSSNGSPISNHGCCFQETDLDQNRIPLPPLREISLNNASGLLKAPPGSPSTACGSPAGLHQKGVLKSLHGAPAGSLAVRLAELMAGIGSPEEMARLWLEVMQEVCVHEVSGSPAGSYGKVVLKFLHGGPAGSLAVRRGLDRLKRRLACGLKSCKRYHGTCGVRDQWEEGIAIPHVFADMEGADVGVCGVLQQWQVHDRWEEGIAIPHVYADREGPDVGVCGVLQQWQVRYRWEEGIAIPHVFADKEGPDVGVCGVLQQWQVLNCAVAQKRHRHSGAPASRELPFLMPLQNYSLFALQVRDRWEEGIVIPHVYADREGPDVGVCGVLQQWQVLNCAMARKRWRRARVRDRWEEGIAIPHVFADKEGPDVSVCGVLQQWQVLNCAMARKRWRRARVRDRWEEGIAIPHVFADKEGPDVSVCGVLQQWQVLNCAVARKRWRKARVSSDIQKHLQQQHLQQPDCFPFFSETASGDFGRFEPTLCKTCGSYNLSEVLLEIPLESPVRSPPCGSPRGGSPGCFAEENGRVLRQDCGSETGGMRLLMTGARMCVPEVQDGLLITSMYIAELEEAVMHTGSLNIAHKRLFSDMQAFKVRCERGKTRLLVTGVRMCVPGVQDGPLITSMYLEELEEAVMHMQAFKAANPGCILEDFVRWYSPADWSSDAPSTRMGGGGAEGGVGGDAGGTGGEGNDSSGSSDEEGCVQGKGERSTIGYLSTRMSGPDNKWRLYWSEAKPMPALLQPPLFDECEAGARSLEYLENISPSELFIQLFTCLVSVGCSAALQVAPFVRESSSKATLEDAVKYILHACRRHMTQDRMRYICMVYEAMEQIITDNERSITPGNTSTPTAPSTSILPILNSSARAAEEPGAQTLDNDWSVEFESGCDESRVGGGRERGCGDFVAGRKKHGGVGGQVEGGYAVEHKGSVFGFLNGDSSGQYQCVENTEEERARKSCDNWACF
ncbi:unnamed protein product [Closterium sp. NIES-65]|nr:unnamed protein product [Closterium sp. NIES-65]